MEADTLKLYLGCYAMHGNKRIHVCGMNVNSHKIQNILGEETIPITEIKLLLRPLSSMTEEEAKVYFKLPETAIIFKKNVTKRWTTFEYKWVNDNPRLNIEDGYSYSEVAIYAEPKEVLPETFLYLLSKGFDLFGLIEKNEALDSTKL